MNLFRQKFWSIHIIVNLVCIKYTLLSKQFIIYYINIKKIENNSLLKYKETKVFIHFINFLESTIPIIQ